MLERVNQYELHSSRKLNDMFGSSALLRTLQVVTKVFQGEP